MDRIRLFLNFVVNVGIYCLILLILAMVGWQYFKATSGQNTEISENEPQNSTPIITDSYETLVNKLNNEWDREKKEPENQQQDQPTTIYQYTDKNGTVNFAEDYNSIPKNRRKYAKEIVVNRRYTIRNESNDEEAEPKNNREMKKYRFNTSLNRLKSTNSRAKENQERQKAKLRRAKKLRNQKTQPKAVKSKRLKSGCKLKYAKDHPVGLE